MRCKVVFTLIVGGHSFDRRRGNRVSLDQFGRQQRFAWQADHPLQPSALRAAIRAISAIGQRTVVSAGQTWLDSGVSSKPTIDSAPGISMPVRARRNHARRSPFRHWRQRWRLEAMALRQQRQRRIDARFKRISTRFDPFRTATVRPAPAKASSYPARRSIAERESVRALRSGQYGGAPWR